MKYQLLVVFYFLTSYSYATNFTTLPELAKYISLITTREDLTTLQASKHFESIKSKNNLLIDLNDDFKALNAILMNQKIREKFFIVICHLGIKNIKIVNAEILRIYIINKFFQKFKEHSTSYSLRTISLVCNNLQIFPVSVSLFTELQELNLAFNSLTILPKEILLLTNLKIINLDNNQFLNFPSILVQMPKLKLVSLLDNPLDIEIISNIKANFDIIFEDPIIEESDDESSTMSLENLLDDDYENNIEII